MEQLTMVSLADKLSAQHDIIISDKQTINVADIFEQIDNLHILQKSAKEYIDMTQEQYYDQESDGKLTILQMDKPLKLLKDRILTNHVDGYVDQHEINLTYNHESPYIDGGYNRSVDLNVLIYSLKVIGAVEQIAADDLRKILSEDAVVSLIIAAHSLASN